jgi:superfamily II DNA or RNA helicase
MSATLRPYQCQLIEQLDREIAACSHIMAQMATGGGKTIVAAAITKRMLEAGKRVLFIVPALELIDQTAERFSAEGIRDIGVIQADHPLTNWSRPVQIASIETLIRASFRRSIWCSSMKLTAGSRNMRHISLVPGVICLSSD